MPKMKSTDEFGNPIPEVKPKGYTNRGGNTGGFGKTRERKAVTGGTIRSKKMEKPGSRSGASARAKGAETGGVKKPGPYLSTKKSSPQSARAAGKKAATPATVKSVRSLRTGKGKAGDSAQVKPTRVSRGGNTGGFGATRARAVKGGTVRSAEGRAMEKVKKKYS